MSSLIELKDRDITAYDMIVSTVPIPYENIDYVMVSPLLNEEDADQVKQYIKRKIPLILDKKETAKEKRSDRRRLICWKRPAVWRITRRLSKACHGTFRSNPLIQTRRMSCF